MCFLLQQQQLGPGRIVDGKVRVRTLTSTFVGPHFTHNFSSGKTVPSCVGPGNFSHFCYASLTAAKHPSSCSRLAAADKTCLPPQVKLFCCRAASEPSRSLKKTRPLPGHSPCCKQLSYSRIYDKQELTHGKKTWNWDTDRKITGDKSRVPSITAK